VRVAPACPAIGQEGGHRSGPNSGTSSSGRPPIGSLPRRREPGAWINPNYAPPTPLALKDGRILVGIVRAEGARRQIRVGTDTDAKTTVIPRAEIEEVSDPAATSIMPVGPAAGHASAKACFATCCRFLTSPPAGGRRAR